MISPDTRPPYWRRNSVPQLLGAGFAAWLLVGCGTGDIGSDGTGQTGDASNPVGALDSAGSVGGAAATDPSQSSPGVDPAESCDGTSLPDTGPAPLRRLTKVEYARTLQQLLQLDGLPDVDGVPDEAEQEGFSVYSSLQTLSAQHLDAYLTVATTQADSLLNDRTRSARVIGCDVSASDCTESFVRGFGRLAYRRALSEEEVTTLVDAALTEGADGADRIRFAIQALLVSPSFLYRVELGEAPLLAEATPQTLTAYEFVSRLSFSLLGRAPDDALLARAESGELASVSARVAMAAALMTQASFTETYEDFFTQWLGFGKLITPKVPPADWDDALLDDMREETRAVVTRFAFEGEPFWDALTTNQTLVTERLAAFYALPSPDAFGQVEVPADHPRAATGLLTHASLLSKKTDGDPVAIRGNWLRRTFLCRGMHIPEAVAASFGERLVGLTHTEIVQERNQDLACKSCHAAIDPIGVGLDAFDATGRFDPEYVVPDYGVSPALPDAPDPEFSDVAELSAKLKGLPDITECLAQRTFLFAHGRQPTARDRCTVEAARDAFISSNYDYRVLVEGLLGADSFSLRRAPEADSTLGGQP